MKKAAPSAAPAACSTRASTSTSVAFSRNLSTRIGASANEWSIDQTLAVLKRCEAGVIVITGDAIDNQLLIQIGAAMVQFERRLLLVVRKGLNLPLEIGGVQRCEVEDEITWDTGLELMRALKRLKAEAI